MKRAFGRNRGVSIVNGKEVICLDEFERQKKEHTKKEVDKLKESNEF